MNSKLPSQSIASPNLCLTELAHLATLNATKGTIEQLANNDFRK